MTMYEIITKKKRGGELTTEEIEWAVDGYAKDVIPDYQMSALLMAICFQGMSDRETADLTMAMARSGEMLRPGLDGFTVDKHSTGGVGDKTTLIVAPTVAACGVYVPKMAGRGLGHTGGTIDKLESIPGFRTELPYREFLEIVRKAGLAVAGQSDELCPADKKMYDLRSATGTVDSIPLICSSVMSKKIATGADGIMLDVKFGDGAFMKTRGDAEKLADAMVRVGELAGRKCRAVISDMSKPLGKAVGNGLEVREAIEALKGNAPADLMEVSLTLAAEMLSLAGKGTPNECRDMAEQAVTSGAALEKLRLMIELQGGDPAVIDDYGLLGKAKRVREVYAEKSGTITGIACEMTGLTALELGAGRKVKGAAVDPAAGIIFISTVGDSVKKGEELALVFSSSDCDIDGIAGNFSGAFCIE